MICNMNDKLTEVIPKMISSAAKTVFCVNKEKELVGTISQGDLVKTLFAGDGSFSLAKDVMQLNPIFLKKEEATSAWGLFKEYRILDIPVVDDQSVITDIISIFDAQND